MPSIENIQERAFRASEHMRCSAVYLFPLCLLGGSSIAIDATQLNKVDTSSVHDSGALVRSLDPKEFDPNLYLSLYFQFVQPV